MATGFHTSSPRVDVSWVPRPRLVARLTGEPGASMVVIVAPSGYGKTTLLSQWDADDDRPFVWVRLDGRHEDPAMLIGAIAAALDRLEPLGDRVFAPLMAPRPNLWNVVVPRLCDALDAGRRPFVLVLDDLHRARNRESVEPLATLAEHMPPRSRLALASRDDPAVPLGRLRTQRGVVELGARELSMNRSEAADLLAQTAPRLSGAAIDVLFESTEGWPAGLYLAALSLERGDASEVIERLRGDDRLVADYLQEEFLASMTADELDFLRRSSVLTRLSGEICDAVLQREGSHSSLRRLARTNLLLVPLDQRGHEYRLHALLREMLVSQLRSDPHEEAALHRRAGYWYAERGEVDLAVPHLIEAGELDAVGEMIWANTGTYASSGRETVIHNWLLQLGEARVAASAPLCLAMATIQLSHGDGAQIERWTATARELLASSGQEGERLESSARLLRSSGAAVDGVVRMEQDIAGIADLLSEDDPWLSLCHLIEGVARQLTGQNDPARRALEEGARRGGVSAPHIQTICLAQHALLALDEGSPGHARQLIERSLSVVEHFGLGEYPTSAVVFAVASLVRVRDGRTADAVHDHKHAVLLLDRLNHLSPWYEAEARIVLARTSLALDQIAEARALLAEAGRHLAKTPDATVLARWAEAAWREADTARAVTDRWPLSPAELRLLHYLPTHLSFREIAGQIFVSANTVKTQARSIYQKLGVSSRGEAVARARSAGLLDSAESATSPHD